MLSLSKYQFLLCITQHLYYNIYLFIPPPLTPYKNLSNFLKVSTQNNIGSQQNITNWDFVIFIPETVRI